MASTNNQLLLLTFLSLATAAAGCGDTDGGSAKSPPFVRTQVVSKVGYTPSTCLTGEVKARVQTNLSFRVSGLVTERSVEVGDHVTPDKILARIDPTEQRADVVSAEAAVRSSEARVRQTEAAFERQKALIKDGFTTKRDYDQAEEALRTAQGSLEASRAQLASTKDALSFTELRAAAPGIITARNAEVGQVAQAAQTMFSLAEDGARDAVFHVYEAAFLNKTESNVVSLSLVSDPKITAKGVVREVSPSTDTASGTVRVKVSITDPPPAFTLGSVTFGCVRLAPRQVVLLSASALDSSTDSPAVWIVDPATLAVTLKPVSIASYETEKVVIDGGLEPGERVVTEGAKMLRPGQIVSINDGAQS